MGAENDKLIGSKNAKIKYSAKFESGIGLNPKIGPELFVAALRASSKILCD